MKVENRFERYSGIYAKSIARWARTYQFGMAICVHIATNRGVYPTKFVISTRVAEVA